MQKRTLRIYPESPMSERQGMVKRKRLLMMTRIDVILSTSPKEECFTSMMIGRRKRLLTKNQKKVKQK
jgi:hypothetical protein